MLRRARISAMLAAGVGLACLAAVPAVYAMLDTRTLASEPALSVPLASAAAVAALPALNVERELTLQRGQTFTDALLTAGFSPTQAQNLTNALAKQADVRKIRAGKTINLTYTETAPYQIGEATLNFRPEAGKVAHLHLKGDTATAKLELKPLTEEKAIAVGHISDSLYEDATRAGLPVGLVRPFVDLFSWDIDFTREIHPGDTFKVMFERTKDDQGNTVKTGKIIAAELWADGKKRAAYLYNGEYLDEKGETKRKLLLRTPLEVFRISSNFGARRHPVLGFTRMHKGTDFAAPTGTPVKASGDGTVVFVGFHGGHGKFVKIKHNSGYSTAYAHLHGYAKGLRVGSKVKQGQIVAYVGSTGVSTGPHLHYEVIKNGSHVNPMSADLPTSTPLYGLAKGKFKAMVADIQTAWNRAFDKVRMAAAEGKSKDL